MTDREAAETLQGRTGYPWVAKLEANPRRWAPAIRSTLAHFEGAPPLPPASTMARNFAAATARDVAHGLARLDDEATAARLAKCRACPGGYYTIDDKGRERCTHSKCGCVLAVKARRPHEHCPIGEW